MQTGPPGWGKTRIGKEEGERKMLDEVVWLTISPPDCGSPPIKISAGEKAKGGGWIEVGKVTRE